MKITVPTSWADVSIRQFVELSKVKELEFDEIDTSLRVLSILTGIDDAEFINLSLPDLKKLSAKTNFIGNHSHEVLKDFNLKIKGNRYRVEWDANNLIAGEYIDIQNYIKNGTYENIHKILAAYLKPVTIFGTKKRGCYKKSREGKTIQTMESRDATAELILDNLPMDKVFAINGFFLHR